MDKSKTSTMAARLFGRLLVPHDFSEHASRALEIAVGLVRPGGTITVLHAMAPVYSSMSGPAGDLAWTPTPEMIAEAMVAAVRAPVRFKPVEADGAARAARMLADLI